MDAKRRKVAPWPTLKADPVADTGGLFDGLPEAEEHAAAPVSQAVPQAQRLFFFRRKTDFNQISIDFE